MAERQRTARLGRIASGVMARALAARLAQHGYLVTFPADRDPAVFKLTRLPGDPDIEVTAEDNGSAACHYAGSDLAEVATVIARLPVPGHSPAQAVVGDAAIAARDGTEIEWHYLTLLAQPVGAEQIAAALLAHLSVVAGWSGRTDTALATGARETGRG